MKTKLVILLSALIGLSAVFNQSANAVDFQITIGDRPYYDGPEFWDWGWHWVWVPGHWDRHHHWIHGYYDRRGDWSKKHIRKRHHWRVSGHH